MSKQQDVAKKFAKALLDDPDYRDTLRLRLATGALAPQLETRLWDYVYGKPVEQSEVTIRDERSLTEMTNEELAAHAKELHELLDLIVEQDKLSVKKEIAE